MGAMRKLGTTFLFVQLTAAICWPAQAAVQGPSVFGTTAEGAGVDLYTLTNDKGMSAKVMTFGAVLVDLKVPDKAGKSESVVLGYDNLQAYEKGSFYGATVGRFANRIADAKFTLDGKEYKLTGYIHGGKRGFNRVLWKAEPLPQQNAVRFSYLSADGEEGYPGNLKVSVMYTVTDKNELRIDYQATTDKATPVNLTNHSYFNLAGPASKSVLDHRLELGSMSYTVFDKRSIPTGEIAPVAGTALDFTKMKRIGDGIMELKKVGAKGYDHNFVLPGKTGRLDVAAKIIDPVSGRVMTVRTDQPGMQVYTSKGDAICFETQHAPNSVNIPEFPSPILRPGRTFRSTTIFAFTLGQVPVFKAGFAERDITPEIGSEMPGGYGKAYHKTFHDACKVRAAVFDDGHKRVALVGIDGLHIRRETVELARQAIAAKTGIPESAILLGASHSHSSGPMAGVMPGEYDHASPLVQKLAYKDAIAADPKYLAKVQQALVEAVADAYAKRVPVKAGIGKGIEDKVAFNRRFKMKNGQTNTHPGQFNPDIVEPAGPTDPEVGVIGAWDDKGRLLGCVVNFACHATTSPGGISANYIYYLEKAVQGYFGKDTVVVFLNGASADITQVDNRSPYKHKSGEQWAQFVGGRVGAEAVKVLLSMEPGTLAPLEADVKMLSIKRRAPSPERVKNCLEIVEQGPKKAGAAEWTFAKEILMADAKIAQHPVAEVEVQAVQIGPAVFLTTPAEYFCAFGLEQKAKSGFPFTFPVSLANGCVGYVPTEDAFGLGGGGYETRLTSYSNLEITAGRQMMQAGIDMAHHLQPGMVPMPPSAKPGQPWAYGNVSPDLR